jgi:hypothetical protein
MCRVSGICLAELHRSAIYNDHQTLTFSSRAILLSDVDDVGNSEMCAIRIAIAQNTNSIAESPSAPFKLPIRIHARSVFRLQSSICSFSACLAASLYSCCNARMDEDGKKRHANPAIVSSVGITRPFTAFRLGVSGRKRVCGFPCSTSQ